MSKRITNIEVQEFLQDFRDRSKTYILEEGKEKNEVIAPHNKISDLPARIRKNMSPSLQRTFMGAFNSAYERHGSDEKAYRIAWEL